MTTEPRSRGFVKINKIMLLEIRAWGFTITSYFYFILSPLFLFGKTGTCYPREIKSPYQKLHIPAKAAD